MARRGLTLQGQDQHRVNRREFLASCATCTACASMLSWQVTPATGMQASEVTGPEKPRIRLVFTHISPEKATWPYQGYDYERRKQELTSRLREGCPNVEFLPATAQTEDEAKKLLETDREVDGYLVYLIGIWSGAVKVIASSGTPTLLVDDLYAGSGEFLIQYAAAKRTGLKVAGVSSSRFEDVIEAVRSFEVSQEVALSSDPRRGRRGARGAGSGHRGSVWN